MQVHLQTPEERRARIRARIQDFVLMDDVFMTAFQLKAEEGEKVFMSSIMEKFRQEAVQQERYQFALRLIKKTTMSVEEIADLSELTVEEVEELIEYAASQPA